VFSKSGPRAVLEKILSDELFARTKWGGQHCADLGQSIT
jgi:hypothetical protein